MMSDDFLKDCNLKKWVMDLLIQEAFESLQVQRSHTYLVAHPT